MGQDFFDAEIVEVNALDAAKELDSVYRCRAVYSCIAPQGPRGDACPMYSVLYSKIGKGITQTVRPQELPRCECVFS